MELTEFLRARIDEDEAMARSAAPRLGDLPPDRFEAWYVNEAASSGDVIVAMHQQRALAEVEAKRRIVEMAERTRRESDDYPGWEGAALHLAQVYADHPDFDPAWRLDVTPASPR